ncbi:bacteriocin leader domain-containing protein [Spiroplasma endosymbiont of Anurida maritima]|uniref:bacteriocin leader domain-containing protein n=1 Tax=Spiroplasma endosymbiont of Anurida maritima TaxID=2967972 RepID=UPI0036D3423F
MKKISINDEKLIIGGAITGAFLAGIAAIITAATTSVCNIMTNSANIYFATQSLQAVEGSIKAPNGNLITWSNKSIANNFDFVF